MALTQPQSHQSISIAATGDAIAAVAGKAIYVYSGFLVAANTVTLVVGDNTTALTGAMSMAVAIPFHLRPNPDGTPLFVTTAGNQLKFTLGSGVQISGWLKYVQA